MRWFRIPSWPRIARPDDRAPRPNGKTSPGRAAVSQGIECRNACAEQWAASVAEISSGIAASAAPGDDHVTPCSHRRREPVICRPCCMSRNRAGKNCNSRNARHASPLLRAAQLPSLDSRTDRGRHAGNFVSGNPRNVMPGREPPWHIVAVQMPQA